MDTRRGRTALSTAPRLVVTWGPLRGQVVELDRDEVVIGRHRGCDVILDSPHVSGRHAKVTRSGTGMHITDLRTLGGTLVNGARARGPVPLGHGDEVSLGGVTLVFQSP
jgi:pSer/pThr/pTyr-binding forkhead associated (FHA) protein